MIATRESRADDLVAACVRAQADAEDVLDVYGGLRGLRLGIRVANDLFVQKDFVMSLRYVTPSNRWAGNGRSPGTVSAWRTYRSRSSRFRTGMGLLKTRSLTPGIDAIAGVFEQTLSRDGGRIQVIGAREHLQREANVARVRALLLAGFRRLSCGASWAVAAASAAGLGRDS